MSFDCTCHVGTDGRTSEKRQPCIGHIDWCGCGKECNPPTLRLGLNAAKRERRKRKGKQ